MCLCSCYSIFFRLSSPMVCIWKLSIWYMAKCKVNAVQKRMWSQKTNIMSQLAWIQSIATGRIKGTQKHNHQIFTNWATCVYFYDLHKQFNLDNWFVFSLQYLQLRVLAVKMYIRNIHWVKLFNWLIYTRREKKNRRSDTALTRSIYYDICTNK